MSAYAPIGLPHAAAERWSRCYRARVTATVTIRGVRWDYSKLLGWHSPSDQHAALWPTGGAT